MRQIAFFLGDLTASVLAILSKIPGAKRFFLIVAERTRLNRTTIESKSIRYQFYTPNQITLYRAKTLFSKEPETLDWISSFGPNDVFYDVGANVGTYSVFVALNQKAKRVYCFEPESQNYAALNRNLWLNDLSDKVEALNIALSNETKLGHLFLSTFNTGEAIHSFDQAIDFNRKPTKAAFKQGVVSMKLDDFIERYNPLFPTHLKIDVDGLEREVIEGARKTLADPRLKSVLIEINENLKEDVEILNLIRGYGFRQAEKRHAEFFDKSIYSAIFNYVFVRETIA